MLKVEMNDTHCNSVSQDESEWTSRLKILTVSGNEPVSVRQFQSLAALFGGRLFRSLWRGRGRGCGSRSAVRDAIFHAV